MTVKATYEATLHNFSGIIIITNFNSELCYAKHDMMDVLGKKYGIHVKITDVKKTTKASLKSAKPFSYKICGGMFDSVIHDVFLK